MGFYCLTSESETVSTLQRFCVASKKAISNCVISMACFFFFMHTELPEHLDSENNLPFANCIERHPTEARYIKTLAMSPHAL